mgnify:CR=1 FL=1
MNEDQVVQTYSTLVKSIARRYKGLPFEDLVQEGMMGLVLAWRKYDPNRGVLFPTYAQYHIKKQILLALGKENHRVCSLSEFQETNLPAPESNDSRDPLVLPASMPIQEKIVLRLSFERQKPLKEIASAMNLRVEQVRILKAKALRRIKASSSNLLL